MASQPGPVPHANEASHAPPKPRAADACEAEYANGAPARHLQRSIGNRALAKLAHSAGRPLEPSVRADLEVQTGEDLGAVRVHHDRESAESLGAQGFAVGEHVVTRATATQDDANRKLLAHEVDHVLEQRHGRKEIARQEQPETPAHQVTRTQDGDQQNVLIDGVRVLHHQLPENPDDISVGIAWSSEQPKLIQLSVLRKSTVSALLDLEGLKELQKRGFEFAISDLMQHIDLSERGERNITLRPPPPKPRPVAQKPKPPVEKKAPPIKLPDLPKVDEVKTDDQLPIDVAPVPVDTQAAPPAALPQPTPKDLIDQRTSWWGNLDEDALGADLLKQAMNADPDYAQRVLDEVGSTDRDDVSLAFAQAATDEQLQQLASTEKGRRLLDRLFDELTDGEVFADEQQQADRILRIKTHSLLSEDQFAAGVTKAQSRTGVILPYRKTGLTVMTPSPIYAHRMPDGKISVHVRFDIYGTDYARDPDLRLPPSIWDQVILNESDVVGVKLYDEGGTIEFMPALKLLQYSNEADRIAYEKAGEAFGIGLTFGLGGEAAAGGEALEGTTLSTGARILAGAQRGLAIADRVATAIDIGNSILQEHRGWIIESSPQDGRSFVTAMDQLTSYVRIYGVVRGGIGIVQLANNLRKSYRNWRAFAGALKDLSESQKSDLEKIGSDTEHLLQEIDSATNVQDISSAQQRRYPPDVARKLEATPEGQGDVLPLRKNVAANEDVESEIPQQHVQQQPDQQQMLRASGDLETRASATRGPKGPQKPAPPAPRTTTRGPARGGTRGGAGGVTPQPRPQLRRVLPEHLDEPKLLPRGINNYGAGDAFDFFRNNQARYPKHVQDMIAAVTVPTKSANEAIDAALRDFYAQQANTALGFPAANRQVARPAPVPGGRILEQSSPFTTSEKGHAPSRANPGTEVEAGFTPTPLGDRKNLNLVGHTKSGEVVKLDDFNFSDRSGEEIKMPGALVSDPRYAANSQEKIIDELRRHYEFTKDWGFNPYRWTLLSEEDYDIVRELARENLPAGWERYVTISWIDAGAR